MLSHFGYISMDVVPPVMPSCASEGKDPDPASAQTLLSVSRLDVRDQWLSQKAATWKSNILKEPVSSSNGSAAWR